MPISQGKTQLLLTANKIFATYFEGTRKKILMMPKEDGNKNIDSGVLRQMYVIPCWGGFHLK